MKESRKASLKVLLRSEAASGILLILCTALALAWANSPWRDAYGLFESLRLGGHAGPLLLPHSPLHWINDGLMAVFFLLVGLEIKREMVAGDLAQPRKAGLPIAAALGGMAVPALLYAACNRGGPGTPGWGIPMATDIAFALGVLSLLGSRVPPGLRIFLAALAILDDLGAVLVIAFFYTSTISGPALGAAAALMLVLVALGRAGVRSLVPYLVLGAGLWLAVLQSGVHATIAGVLLAFAIPFQARDGGLPPLARLEHALLPWVRYAVLPLFAIANAGVPIEAGQAAALAGPIGLGVASGLLAGKPIGILLAAWLAVRLRFGELPKGVGWKHLAGCALLGGIGFTMSIFIAGLALRDPADLQTAKLAVLAASACSGFLGWAVLRRLGPGRRAAPVKAARED